MTAKRFARINANATEGHNMTETSDSTTTRQTRSSKAWQTMGLITQPPELRMIAGQMLVWTINRQARELAARTDKRT